MNYTPYSCMKIIFSSVGPGDAHGCPFKHSDVSSLRQQLLSYNIPVAGKSLLNFFLPFIQKVYVMWLSSCPGIQEVVDNVTRGHYQVACAKYFEITHRATIDSGVHHPNKYFEESQKVISGRCAMDVGELLFKARVKFESVKMIDFIVVIFWGDFLYNKKIFRDTNRLTLKINKCPC